jgi:predicted peptidase
MGWLETCLWALVLPAMAQDYEARVFTNADGAALPYRLLQPPKASPAQKCPLVLFLHGAGERGTDNQAQLVHGAPLFLKPQIRAQFPCFVVAPQCPTNRRWVEMDWGAEVGTQPSEPSEPMKLVMDLLERLPREYPIDSERIYVTGLSMGGFGTWDLITRFPGRFAAAVPICGGGDAQVAARAAKTPVWAFHSDDDTVVKVRRTRDMIAGMRQAGGQPHYFEYRGLGHGAWDKAYAEPELLSWMFAQRLGRAEAYDLLHPNAAGHAK